MIRGSIGSWLPSLETAGIGCGMTLDELPTPALIVDLDVVERNVRRWQAQATAHGARFRPHAKTHKTIELGRMQVAAGACGITVAKVSEAEVYVAAGFDDVVVAYPVVAPDAAQRLAALAARARIGVNVENPLAAEVLSRAAVAAGAEVDVHLDLDTGLGRCGVPVEDVPGVRALAEAVDALPGLRLRGVTTYRGASYPGAADRATAGREEAELAVSVARTLGLSEVAAGSTPSGRAVAAAPGVTEVRAGTYVFNDLMQLRWGSADPADCALTILTTVVSAQRDGRVTVDGGSKTFSGDAAMRDGERPVYARSVDGSIAVDGLTEEHGVAAAERAVQVGERIPFIPAHVCTTVNLSDQLVGLRGGRVEAIWPVAARGRRT
jgi:D-serine deaminase-like pyridoxal phosphate-dependent protein